MKRSIVNYHTHVEEAVVGFSESLLVAQKWNEIYTSGLTQVVECKVHVESDTCILLPDNGEIENINSSRFSILQNIGKYKFSGDQSLIYIFKKEDIAFLPEHLIEVDAAHSGAFPVDSINNAI